MASKSFTDSEWKKIRTLLDKDPDRFGLPRRVYGSVVLASFNIRNLGAATKRKAATWQFLADACRHFDLLAVQEIQGDLTGLRKLKDLMGTEKNVSSKIGLMIETSEQARAREDSHSTELVEIEDLAVRKSFDVTPNKKKKD